MRTKVTIVRVQHLFIQFVGSVKTRLIRFVQGWAPRVSPEEIGKFDSVYVLFRRLFWTMIRPWPK